MFRFALALTALASLLLACGPGSDASAQGDAAAASATEVAGPTTAETAPARITTTPGAPIATTGPVGQLPDPTLMPAATQPTQPAAPTPPAVQGSQPVGTGDAQTLDPFRQN